MDIKYLGHVFIYGFANVWTHAVYISGGGNGVFFYQEYIYFVRNVNLEWECDCDIFYVYFGVSGYYFPGLNIISYNTNNMSQNLIK